MVKKIRFTIDAQGEVHLDVQGTVGAECDALTAPFEDKLGIVASKQRKDTFFSNQEQETQDVGTH
ncbi:DUF2997 domain-containing protein [bacterium]|nr:DUF2997 domain-containing protein [bacterium]